MATDNLVSGGSDTQQQRRNHLASLLEMASQGDLIARNELCCVVYDELRIAARKLIRRRGAGGFRPTALVHDLMAKFLQPHCLEKLANCRCFLAVAVDAMEKMLVDQHRSRHALKRGGDREEENLDMVLDQVESENQFKFSDLHDALEKLAGENSRQYEVVKYRFFGGLSVKETATLLGVSIGSVERDWRLARAKLHADLKD